MKTISNPVGALLKHFTITLFITTLGLILGNQLPYSLVFFVDEAFLVLFILSIILTIFIKRPKNSQVRRGFPMFFTYSYAFIFGVIITPTISYYINDIGADIVLAVFIGTLFIVGALALFSFIKGNDNILKLQPILLITLLCLCIASFVILGIFNISGSQLLITIISTILFSLYVIYDVYRFKKDMYFINTTRDLSPYVLDLYLDFINLFLDILRIVARFKSDD